MAGFGEDLQGIRDTSRRNDTDSYAKYNGEDGQQPRRALHFINAAVSFARRLLDHHRPIQRGYWAVGAEHDCALMPGAYFEFSCGSYHLRLAAILHEVAHDFQA